MVVAMTTTLTVERLRRTPERAVTVPRDGGGPLRARSRSAAAAAEREKGVAGGGGEDGALNDGWRISIRWDMLQKRILKVKWFADHLVIGHNGRHRLTHWPHDPTAMDMTSQRRMTKNSEIMGTLTSDHSRRVFVWCQMAFQIDHRPESLSIFVSV